MNCNVCGTEIQENTNFCPNCGEKTEPINNNKLGMKYYKYQACFLMPISVLLDVILGVLLISGNFYKLIGAISGDIIGSSTAILQSELKWLDVAYGIFLIAVAFYRGYITYALIKFKSGAIRHLYIITVLTEVSTLVYLTASMIMMKGFIQFDAKTVSELIKEVVSAALSITFWVLVYNKYYGKRKHLFVN